MMRVVMISSQSRDVRARRLARWLVSQGHEVIHVAGWQVLPERVVLGQTADIDGCRTYLHHADAGSALQAAVCNALKPDVVWCHGLAALWRYAGESGATAASVEARLRGASLPASGWSTSRGPVPIVYDAHEYERGRSWAWQRPSEVQEWSDKERMAIRTASHVVTVSEPIGPSSPGRSRRP